MTSLPTIPSALHIAGGFSLDAVIHADGRIETNRIGGNALWATAGAVAIGGAPHAHAVLGRAFPHSALERLAELGVDCNGIHRRSERTGVRVTYAYAADGSRLQPAPHQLVAELPQTERQAFIDTTRMPEEILGSLPAAEDLPIDLSGTSWHLGLLPVARFTELIDGIRRAGADYLQADCPARSELAQRGTEVLGAMLTNLDVFLPSTSDTNEFLPDVPPLELISTFHAMGAEIVVLKMGEHGAIVAERGSACWHVPIFPEPAAIDPTGAGDVFAGAFATQLARAGDLVRAAASAAALASASTRYRDPFAVAVVDPDEIATRTQFIERKVTKL